MWFLLLLIPCAVSAVTSLVTLTHGVTIIVTAAAADQWQRRKGYKPGEGTFTERENDTYYGVEISELSPHELSARLGDLAAAFPKEFGPYINRRFDLTKSEGEMLRSLLAPVLRGMGDLMIAYELYRETPDDIEALALVEEATESVRLRLRPVLLFLEQFPQTRTKAA